MVFEPLSVLEQNFGSDFSKPSIPTTQSSQSVTLSSASALSSSWLRRVAAGCVGALLDKNPAAAGRCMCRIRENVCLAAQFVVIRPFALFHVACIA